MAKQWQLEMFLFSLIWIREHVARKQGFEWEGHTYWLHHHLLRQWPIRSFYTLYIYIYKKGVCVLVHRVKDAIYRITSVSFDLLTFVSLNSYFLLEYINKNAQN